MTHPIIIRFLAAAVVFGVAILVHEAGHFILAKRKGVKVEKFSIGFGPKLLGFRRGDTQYLLSLIPLGGYLKMAGENPGEGEGAPDEFFSKTPFDRIKIVAAGPFMNLILAYVVIVGMFTIGIRLPDYSNQIGSVHETLQKAGLQTGDFIVEIEGEEISNWQTLRASVEKLSGGNEQCSITVLREGNEIRLRNIRAVDLLGLSPLIPAEVGEVAIGMPGYSAGILAGDKVISIDGEATMDWDELAAIIHRSADKEIELRIGRGANVFPVSVTPISHDVLGDNIGIIGISPPASDYYVKRFGWKSVPYALETVVQQVAMTYRMLWLIVRYPAKFRKFIGGPILIVQMAGEEAKKGLGGFLGFMGSINILLAVMNLIPFPVLDGGHVMFFLIEKLRRRPLSLNSTYRHSDGFPLCKRYYETDQQDKSPAADTDKRDSSGSTLRMTRFEVCF
jgi:regulator of sigma E protease